MDAWLEIVIRQIILYSLPVLVSLSMVGMFEARMMSRPLPHAFYPLSWRVAWLPLLVAIMFHRAVIFALPRPVHEDKYAALMRLSAHGLLCGIGFLLYAWSLGHAPAQGLPPLHHWWSKVLMYFNLCMVFLHLLPLPGMLVGEWVLPRLASRFPLCAQRMSRFGDVGVLWLWLVLAASPLPDAILGAYGIFPLYAEMATSAVHLLH
ncbi:MAG: hypothetical protein Q9M30_10335 [Mariprofundaceae bacterium]|nr:hypothetical protein [Mariprofundaceae bacterium]